VGEYDPSWGECDAALKIENGSAPTVLGFPGRSGEQDQHNRDIDRDVMNNGVPGCFAENPSFPRPPEGLHESLVWNRVITHLCRSLNIDLSQKGRRSIWMYPAAAVDDQEQWWGKVGDPLPNRCRETSLARPRYGLCRIAYQRLDRSSLLYPPKRRGRNSPGRPKHKHYSGFDTQGNHCATTCSPSFGRTT